MGALGTHNLLGRCKLDLLGLGESTLGFQSKHFAGGGGGGTVLIPLGVAIHFCFFIWEVFDAIAGYDGEKGDAVRSAFFTNENPRREAKGLLRRSFCTASDGRCLVPARGDEWTATLGDTKLFLVVSILP